MISTCSNSELPKPCIAEVSVEQNIGQFCSAVVTPVEPVFPKLSSDSCSQEAWPLTISTDVDSCRVGVGNQQSSLPVDVPESTLDSPEQSQNTQESRPEAICRSRRARITLEKKVELEQRFAQDNYIHKADAKLLGERLDLSDYQVRNWFQNRRAKERREIAKMVSELHAVVDQDDGAKTKPVVDRC